MAVSPFVTVCATAGYQPSRLLQSERLRGRIRAIGQILRQIDADDFHAAADRRAVLQKHALFREAHRHRQIRDDGLLAVPRVGVQTGRHIQRHDRQVGFVYLLDNPLVSALRSAFQACSQQAVDNDGASRQGGRRQFRHAFFGVHDMFRDFRMMLRVALQVIDFADAVERHGNLAFALQKTRDHPCVAAVVAFSGQYDNPKALPGGPAVDPLHQAERRPASGQLHHVRSGNAVRAAVRRASHRLGLQPPHFRNCYNFHLAPL